jgi:hypothetical protein
MERILKAWCQWAGAVCLLLTLASCASWHTRYLREATNHATQREVEAHLGSPQDTWALATGETLWTYERGFQAGTEGGGMTIVGPGWTIGRSPGCTAYTLRFDREEVLRAWMRQPCSPDLSNNSPPASQAAPRRPRTRENFSLPRGPVPRSSRTASDGYCGGLRSAPTNCSRQPSGSRKLTVVLPVAGTKFGVRGMGTPLVRSSS